MIQAAENEFSFRDRKRVSVRLVKMTMQHAEAIKVKIEAIVSVGISGHAIDDETARWVSSFDETLATKLSRVGLIPKRESEELFAFVDAYITKRTDVALDTRKAWRQGLDHLVDHFGPDKPLRSLTKGDATEWRLSLIRKKHAEATIRKYSGYAKQFINAAVELELIPSDPFAKLPSAPIGNRKRDYFVTREETRKVIEACPDAEWRLIVALSRYGGLRCPLEYFRLRLEDILWEQQRFIVHSPKTERYEGHETRMVPLFHELPPYLDDVFDRAEPGAEYVLSRYNKSKDKSGGANLRTQLTRIVKRAGLKPWARITHNMRASRQTKLEDAGHPSHVVCAWMGNSEPVARKHYLQVTDDHFAAAVVSEIESGAATREMCRKPSQIKNAAHEKNPVLQGVSSDCDALRQPPTGVDGNRTHQITFQRSHWV